MRTFGNSVWVAAGRDAGLSQLFTNFGRANGGLLLVSITVRQPTRGRYKKYATKNQEDFSQTAD
jgi:hypothetical protein